jgi:hypothetical protein
MESTCELFDDNTTAKKKKKKKKKIKRNNFMQETKEENPKMIFSKKCFKEEYSANANEPKFHQNPK